MCYFHFIYIGTMFLEVPTQESAQRFVVRNATVNDAMNHAVRDCQKALVFTATHVSGSVGSNVPSSAEFVIKTK